MLFQEENVKVKIICVGKLKEKYLVAGIQEYVKRLSAYTKVDIIELKDERIIDDSKATQDKVKDIEGQRILEKIKKDDFVYLLDVQGQMVDSVEFSKTIEKCMIDGKSSLVFVIGGSLGHGLEIYQRADATVSFSKMTFPHQLMRLILVEQIYRAFKIMKHETYHK